MMNPGCEDLIFGIGFDLLPLFRGDHFQMREHDLCFGKFGQFIGNTHIGAGDFLFREIILSLRA